MSQTASHLAGISGHNRKYLLTDFERAAPESNIAASKLFQDPITLWSLVVPEKKTNTSIDTSSAFGSCPRPSSILSFSTGEYKAKRIVHLS